MSMNIRKIALASALALGTALPASAATLNGVFTIEIYNFSDTPGDSTVVTQTNSAATPANFAAQTLDATVTYTGDIFFGIPSGNSGSTTIDNFLKSAGGNYSIDSSLIDLTNTLLSQGNYTTTTFFKIMGSFASAVEGVITHDDGITLVGNSVTGGVSAPPTSAKTTDFTAGAGDFTLFYAAANGNPSILKVDATPIPLPAGGVLLLTALGGLAIARRRTQA